VKGFIEQRCVFPVMTVTTSKTVWCDGEDCHDFIQETTTRASRVREIARDRGWACHSGGDFCPDCNTK